ncbi:MAG: Flp family type IVb pilin [Brevundimonas sp.]
MAETTPSRPPHHTDPRDERGASAVEYGLILGAIAAVIVIVVFALGGPTQGLYNNACDGWQEEMTGTTC